MTRWFYTDPLAAAWMAKHFGMAYAVDGLVDGESIAAPRLFASKHIFEDKIHLHVSDAVGRRYYIHPDSLHLLEPHKHDLVDFVWIHPCGESFHEMTLLHTGFESFCEESTCDYDSHRIIQRNGKAFIWPEVER
ncbi:hypothetical protein [Zavarzinella formosa]|uniref:hypothetical protein n=1 Tax=Zavarzinella formosa TaxID=360055 RepID=UPI00035F881C|nr:hypothetical protein [Zavarzinella formosa]